MKTTFLPITLSIGVLLTTSLALPAHELPSVDQLPDRGKHWLKKDEGTTKDGKQSWVNFDNTQSGDVLSFVAWSVPSGRSVMDSPVRQASTETFNSDGYALISTRHLGDRFVDTLRNRFVSIYTDGKGEKLKAIEFSKIYRKRPGDAPSTMGHGYVVVVGDVVLFVQNTSKKIITAELAEDMLFGVLGLHLDMGASYGIHRSDTSER